MRKTLAVAILFVMLAALTLTGVKAATVAETLVDNLYDELGEYGLPKEYKKRMTDLFKDISLQKANNILSEAKYAASVMEAAGAEKYEDLNAEQREEVKNAAKYAAEQIGYKLVTENGVATLYDNLGEKVEELNIKDYLDGKLPYTGADNVVVAVSVVAVIALAAVVVVRTKIGA